MVDLTVGRRFNGDAPHGDRQADDFYPTPQIGTESLLRVEKFSGPIWEPACGDGAICRVLSAAGHEVIASDLVDRGLGGGDDFLLSSRLLAPNIVTNPPFGIALEFVRHALSLCPIKVAMLMQLRFLEGIERGMLFDKSPPSRVFVFRRRLAIASGPPARRETLFGPIVQDEGTKGGMLAFAWFVWDRSHVGKCNLDWI